MSGERSRKPKAYRLLMHDTFLQAYFALQEEDTRLSASLITQINKSKADPTSGSPLDDVLNPALAGKLRKLHVGGRKGLRFVYLFHAGLSVVLPIFLSAERKPKFRWEQNLPSIEVAAQQILADYQAKDWSKFQEV